MPKQSDNERNDPVQPEWLIEGHRSGTKYEIDAKGTTEGGEAFLIVECKRYGGRRVDQGKVSDLAYRILDTRADGAILVSPMGFQAGAKKIADAENIISVQLNQDATPTDFVMQFFYKIRVGIKMSAKSSVVAKSSAMRACAKCGKTYPSEEHGSLCGDCR